MSEVPSHEELTRAVYGDWGEEYAAEMAMWRNTLVDGARAHLAAGVRPSAAVWTLVAKIHAAVGMQADLAYAFASSVVALAEANPRMSEPPPTVPEPVVSGIAQWVVVDHSDFQRQHVFEDAGHAYAYAASCASSGRAVTIVGPDKARIIMFRSEATP